MQQGIKIQFTWHRPRTPSKSAVTDTTTLERDTWDFDVEDLQNLLESLVCAIMQNGYEVQILRSGDMAEEDDVIDVEERVDYTVNIKPDDGPQELPKHLHEAFYDLYASCRSGGNLVAGVQTTSKKQSL